VTALGLGMKVATGHIVQVRRFDLLFGSAVCNFFWQFNNCACKSQDLLLALMSEFGTIFRCMVLWAQLPEHVFIL
jgi:hypothetical protein